MSPAPAGPDPDVVRTIQAIADGLRSLARGENVSTELHNIRAHVLNALDRFPGRPDLRGPADDQVANLAT